MTSTDNPPRADIATIEANLAALTRTVQVSADRTKQDMEDIKELLQKLSDSLNAVIITDGDRAVRLAQLEEWKKGIDIALVASKDDRQQLWRKVDKLEGQLSLVRWVGGLVGGGAITWIIVNLLGLLH